MRVGTKSILFGAHCFFLHPFFVAWAWWRLYGAPLDPRLWVAFIVHDLGYWGCAHMDDEQGEMHPWFGAVVMGRLFGERWFEFALYHSRFLAKKYDRWPSQLCIADKYAIVLTPWWLYIPMTTATGEIREYMTQGPARDPAAYPNGFIKSKREWFANMTTYMRRWVEAHKDGAEDTWTPTDKERCLSGKG